jgi:hypothetical protein
VLLGVVPIDLSTAMASPNITQDEWHSLRKTNLVKLSDEEVGGEVCV